MATSYEFDRNTLDRIASLKSAFGTKTSVGVLKRAVALAHAISEQANVSDGSLVIGAADGTLFRVVIVG